MKSRVTEHTPYIRSSNMFWDQLNPYLQRVLEPEEIANLSHNDIELLYTCLRIGHYDAKSTRALRHRLAEIAPNVDSSAFENLGYPEADLLLWCLTPTTHRLLNLIGPRGVGKSILLRWVLMSVLRRLDTSSIPLFVECRRAPNELSPGMLVDAVLRGMRDMRDSSQGKGISILAQEYDLATKTLEEYRGREWGESSKLYADIPDIINRLSEAGSVVLVFDNVDQLSQQSITRVITLARATALSVTDRARVIVATRPFTRRRQFMDHMHLGAFFAYSITVTPPLMAAIIKKRGERAKEFVRQLVSINKLDSEQLRLFRHCVDRIETLMSDHRLEDMIVSRLSNLDMRRAFTSLRSIVRSPHIEAFLREELPHDILKGLPALSLEEQRGLRAGGESIRTERVLASLMLQEGTYYQDRYSWGYSPIVNLFDPRDIATHEPCVLLIPRLLEFLDSCGDCGAGIDSLDAVFLQLSPIPISSQSKHAILQMLLSRGLIESDEHDELIDYVRRVHLSRSGKYYITELIESAQYLYHVVTDVRLEHRGFYENRGPQRVINIKEAENRHFSSVVHSISELIERAIDEDRMLLDTLFNGNQAVGVSAAKLMRPLLSKYVLKAAMGNARRHDYLVPRPVREASELLIQRIETRWVPEIERLETRWRQFVEELYRDSYTRSVRLDIPSGGVFVARLPSTSSQRKFASVECEVEPHNVDGIGSITVCIDLQDGRLSDDTSNLVTLAGGPDRALSHRWNIETDNPRGRINGRILALSDQGVVFAQESF